MFQEKERIATEKLIDADLVLVAPRHLFRMPYSLHEKTALASIVIDKGKVKDFQIKDAKPFKAEIINFHPESKNEEAKELLLQALDWSEQNKKEEKQIEERKISFSPAQSSIKKSGDFKKIEISNPSEEIFPPCIKLLLKGIDGDGRKRALFLLLNFFKSLGLPENEIEKRINGWNEKNSQPLKKGYIQSQLSWYKRNSPKLPPNCDKPNYRDLSVCKPDELCRQIKNPVNYAIKKYFRKNKLQ
jgi:DNA primase large subunit